ncbi:hypothetical protein AMR41_03900 [Hapalosiphon sp. MRB220]|nr:hypothetical protein AMR41_03900 [Hapalosiphon sp. MRB220]
MLKQLWRYIKRLIQRLFRKKPSVSIVSEEPQPAPQLTDAEYESLFLQLLEGVNEGWSRGNVRGFLDGHRISEAGLVGWLRGFGDGLLASDTSHDELAQRMVQLGALDVGELGEVAREIELQLLRRGGETNRRVTEDTKKKEEKIQTVTLDELRVLLQKDTNLAQQIAEQVGIETTDPEMIIQALIDQSNAFGDSTNDEVETYLKQAMKQFNAGDFEEAIASFDKAVEIKPDYHEAWFLCGVVLDNLGRYEDAIASYDKAVEIKPDYRLAWYNRGNALDNLGRYEDAIASFDKAVEIKPDYHLAWHKRGIALDNLGRYEEAITSYDKAVEIKPDYYEAWYNRGNALSDFGRYEEAIASYDQAVNFKPDFPEAWTNRGLKLEKLHYYEEATASFKRALEINPNFPEVYNAWNGLGGVHASLGQLEDAILAYDQALKFKPDLHNIWINRGVAAGKSFSYNPFPSAISAIIIQNPALNKRGYEGELASYQEGLKHCQQHTHPEGWGLLHHWIGQAHYFQGVGEPNYREYWREAESEYHQALITLTQETFPELHLEVVRNLIRILFGLNKDDEAKQWRRHGLEIFRELINSPQKSSQQKRQLEVEFSGFSQMRVDVLVEDGDLVTALEVAERNKNRYLTWILDAQNEHILSPSYIEIQELINPTTAIIYWHLSPFALTTFIIPPGADQPIVIPTPNRQELETWIKNWDQQYKSYRNRKQKTDSSKTSPFSRGTEGDLNWHNNLPELLAQLNHILNIPAILTAIPNSQIHNLILIPHLDLHRFPLHSLFPRHFTIAYLPSVQIGKNLQRQPSVQIWDSQTLLSVEHPNSAGLESLPYAQIESAIISQLFPHPTTKRISNNAASKTAVQTSLEARYSIFHFTGHASYDSEHPQQSALYLSGKDRLTLTDICNLNLNHYQLVSLSGCETAITGNETIKQEYVGLVSAFLYKDVSYVISSLWTVNEVSSSLLMVYFYLQLKQGQSPAIALTAAINWLRHLTYPELATYYQNTLSKLLAHEKSCRRLLERYLELNQNQPGKLFDSPYHWAAFTITGKHN